MIKKKSLLIVAAITLLLGACSNQKESGKITINDIFQDHEGQYYYSEEDFSSFEYEKMKLDKTKKFKKFHLRIIGEDTVETIFLQGTVDGQVATTYQDFVEGSSRILYTKNYREKNPIEETYSIISDDNDFFTHKFAMDSQENISTHTTIMKFSIIDNSNMLVEIPLEAIIKSLDDNVIREDVKEVSMEELKMIITSANEEDVLEECSNYRRGIVETPCVYSYRVDGEAALKMFENPIFSDEAL